MYARLAEKLADTGWANCIPLVPGTKRALVPWRVHRIFVVTDEQRAAWGRRFADAGVGYVLEPEVVAVEADVLDSSTAERLGVLAEQILGVTPLIRIGRAPKWMRFYGTDELVPKIAAHPIEVIPASYHTVLYGVHEFTRRPYLWLDGEPLDTPPERLPRVTPADLERFVDASLALIPERRSVPRGVDGDLFTRLRDERAGRRGVAWLATVERQLRGAVPGELHDTLLSVTAALVGVGYTDNDIHAIVTQHFAAPRSGPYAAVWSQLADAIAGARRRWSAPAAAQPRARLQAVPA